MSAGNFEELMRHYGHDVNVVVYGLEDNVENVAIECETCGEVLLDYDKEESK